jgi:quercetin dioxygenase-like cupin family protein
MSNATNTSTAVIADFDAIDPVRCPCGWARRALGDVGGAPASIHRTLIEHDARTHYHREHTEIYYILECGPDAAMELDGAVRPVHVGSVVYIPPGVRHRAVGRMTILNVVVPPFDPADEWFD